MIAVVVSLTMESPMMSLEKIIFGTINQKIEILNTTINDDIKELVGNHVYDNIAMQHEIQPGEDIMVPQNFINQPLDVSVDALTLLKSPIHQAVHHL